MKKLGFEKQENGVIFTTSLLAVLIANLLVKFGYLIKIFKIFFLNLFIENGINRR